VQDDHGVHLLLSKPRYRGPLRGPGDIRTAPGRALPLG
jgi:hypothetical protein